MSFLLKTFPKSSYLVQARIIKPFLVQITAGRQEYMQMLKTLDQGKAETIVKWAMEKLKKNDIIVWFLNNIKGDPSLFTEELQEHIAHMQGMRETTPRLASFQFKAKWTLQEGSDEFKNAERLAQAETIKKNKLVPAKGKILLKLDGGYAWWDLGVGSCKDEADAMGHCGNVPSEKEGDHIISLRREMDVQGTPMYDPHLTFILNHGFLGEMKGKANEKPKEKYHKAIVALLLSPAVKKIWGGGYESHKNFEFDDLTKTEQQMILAKKPNIVIDKLKKIDDENLPDKHKSDATFHNKDIEYLEKELDGKKLTQEAIAEIAVDGKDANARAAATRRLRDQNIIKQVALKDKEELAIREQAIRLLHDQPTLISLVQKGTGEKIDDDVLAYAALFNLKDQKTLEQVALNPNKSLEQRRMALSKLKDPKVIKKVAIEGGSAIQRDAVERLEDQQDLKDIALNGELNADARKLALHKIDDPAFFVQFVGMDVADEGFEVKDYVIQYKIDNPKILEKLALGKGKKAGARLQAIKKVTNQDVLKKVAEQDERDFNRQVAIQKIGDQDFLLKVAKTDPIDRVRAEAVSKLTDENILKQIAEDQDEDLVVRIAAIKNVTDQKFILDLIENFDTKEDVSETKMNRLLDAAVSAVTSQKDLEKIALNHSNESARMTATHRLDNQKILKRIALKKDESPNVKRVAVNKLTDQETLEKIAKSKQMNTNIRLAAMEKLTSPDALDEISNRRHEDSRYLHEKAGELARKIRRDKKKKTNEEED